MAIQGVPPGGIVTIATEHAAVLDTVQAMGRAGRDITILPVGPDGIVDLEEAARAIRPGTALVAALLVNNETGAIRSEQTRVGKECDCTCSTRGARLN